MIWYALSLVYTLISLINGSFLKMGATKSYARHIKRLNEVLNRTPEKYHSPDKKEKKS